ncbi:sedoheptulose 7-phosphate cyclase [Cohnella panacarvi]|uniref:sedoheptulose 7-phosphate cyclase n=1 Tax=Cohnella panacarvi TaxID=400776 RepID=UPI00047AEA3B|nr:sedoheptulose 7-phosphate cyclase [Cohnella panacarvi]
MRNLHFVDNVLTVSDERHVVNYEIAMTKDIFNPENEVIKKYCNDRKLLVLISESINKLYIDKISNYFSTHFHPEKYKIITINTNEQEKNMSAVLYICNEGKKFKLDRNSLMIGIGGGILLDIVGFAASMYKRKLEYLRIPTTLVGQIDAGIGIKTGINYEGSKNFLGSFYPPKAAINDFSLLSTLEEKEIRCGLSEIVKMAIIRDNQLFDLVEEYGAQLIQSKYRSHQSAAIEINQRAIIRMIEELRVNFYEADLERLVDFGHSFSPYIETSSNYRISHGIAVAMDMALCTEISYLMGLLSLPNRDRILKLLISLGLDVHVGNEDAEGLWDSLNDIVLHRGNHLNLVLPNDIGKAIFIKDLKEINFELIHRSLFELTAFQSRYGRELNV